MSLLHLPLELITHEHLLALCDNKVAEGRTVEFKTEVFDKGDDGKRIRFLGSLAAFANTDGGDIFVGVEV